MRTRRGLMPRLLSRVLFVLGGAVAATVIGWLLSTATASAGTLPVTPPPSVGTAVLHSTSDALGSVAPQPKTTVPPASAPLPTLGGTDGVRDVTGALSRAVTQLGDHVPVDRTVVVAPLTALPSTPTTVSTPAGQSGPAGGHASTRALSVPAAATTPPAPSGSVVAQRFDVRPPAGPTPSAPRHVPARPSVPTPWPPAGVPTAPSGGIGATSIGELGFADQTGTFAVPCPGVVRVVPVTAPLGQVTAGRQPGITPD
ncbi:MAG TPA: hypothetical protein VHF06_23010 [Pseudonocardiaceae bacterium]|nr:hypothetical protein [Pseudonocardiaceae bacterium]